jgi:hypothetical protein
MAMGTVPPVLCSCKVVDEKVQFCALHENAERLLSACEYAQKFLSTLAGSRHDEGQVIQELVLPYLDNVIAAAKAIRS